MHFISFFLSLKDTNLSRVSQAMMTRVCFFVLTLLCLSGCGGTDATGYRTLPLNQDVTLRVGEKVGLAGDSSTELEIKKIRDDSRCPDQRRLHLGRALRFWTPSFIKAPSPLRTMPQSQRVFPWSGSKTTTTTLTVRPRYKISVCQSQPRELQPPMPSRRVTTASPCESHGCKRPME